MKRKKMYELRIIGETKRVVKSLTYAFQLIRRANNDIVTANYEIQKSKKDDMRLYIYNNKVVATVNEVWVITQSTPLRIFKEC